MTTALLHKIYLELAQHVDAELSSSTFMISSVPQSKCYFVGTDRDRKPVLLIESTNDPGSIFAPIQLTNIDVQFAMLCEVATIEGHRFRSRFSIVRCHLTDVDNVRHFMAACSAVLALLGEDTEITKVRATLLRLVSIFEPSHTASRRSVAGLFGELYLLLRSRDLPATLEAWRLSDSATYDFSFRSCHVEVKTSTVMRRSHLFSFEQCHPAFGTHVYVVSLFANQASNGLSIRQIVDTIVSRLDKHPALVLKLYEAVARTVGFDTRRLGITRFDLAAADRSFATFDVADIPKLRFPLPKGVDSVRFRSDLSGVSGLQADYIVANSPELCSIFPIKKSQLDRVVPVDGRP